MSFVVAFCDDLACFCLKTDMLDTAKHVSPCHSRNESHLCGYDGIFLGIVFVSKRTCLMLQNMFFMVVVVIFFSLILLLITIFISVCVDAFLYRFLS